MTQADVCTKCKLVIPEDECIANGMHWACFERDHEEAMAAIHAEIAAIESAAQTT